MYEVIVQTFVDGVRQKDMILINKYLRKGNAERKAKEWTQDNMSAQGKRYETRAYIRKQLIPVTEERAKCTYCKGKAVYIDNEFGQDKLRPSYEYGSHASREELFYRSANQFNYGYHYNGNFYIEVED